MLNQIFSCIGPTRVADFGSSAGITKCMSRHVIGCNTASITTRVVEVLLAVHAVPQGQTAAK